MILLLFAMLFGLMGLGFTIWMAMGLSGAAYLLWQGDVSMRIVVSRWSAASTSRRWSPSPSSSWSARR
jgi:hypothetical protein